MYVKWYPVTSDVYQFILNNVSLDTCISVYTELREPWQTPVINLRKYFLMWPVTPPPPSSFETGAFWILMKQSWTICCYYCNKTQCLVGRYSMCSHSLYLCLYCYTHRWVQCFQPLQLHCDCGNFIAGVWHVTKATVAERFPDRGLFTVASAPWLHWTVHKTAIPLCGLCAEFPVHEVIAYFSVQAPCDFIYCNTLVIFILPLKQSYWKCL